MGFFKYVPCVEKGPSVDMTTGEMIYELRNACANGDEMPIFEVEAICTALLDYEKMAPEYENLSQLLDVAQTELGKVKAERDELLLQLKYPDPEDMPGELAAKYCPFKDQLHFHHDGCPSEWAMEAKNERLMMSESFAEKVQAKLDALEKDAERVAPLVAAAEGADLHAGGPNSKEPGKVWCSGKSLKGILRAALAYKNAKKEEPK